LVTSTVIVENKYAKVPMSYLLFSRLKEPATRTMAKNIRKTKDQRFDLYALIARNGGGDCSFMKEENTLNH